MHVCKTEGIAYVHVCHPKHRSLHLVHEREIGCVCNQLPSAMSRDSIALQASGLALLCMFDQVTDNPGISVQPSWLAEDVKSSRSFSSSFCLLIT